MRRIHRDGRYMDPARVPAKHPARGMTQGEMNEYLSFIRKFRKWKAEYGRKAT